MTQAGVETSAAQAPEIIDLRDRSASTSVGDPGLRPLRRVSDRLRPFHTAHRRYLEVALYVGAVVGAWSVRFVQDDAFISFRYARNLAAGRGLVFNAGERVEGYTNFLWTVLMAVPETLGWSTPLFSQVIGIIALVVTLAVAHRLARNVLDDDVLAFLAMIVLLANATFLAYATGGLETMLQTMLTTAVIALLLPVGRALTGRTTFRRLGAGVLAGLALMTRLDSAVLVVAAVVVHTIIASRRRSRGRRWSAAVESVALIALPAVAVVEPWLTWKWSFYGRLLPNTFGAKAGGSSVWPIAFGVVYLAAYFVGYFYFVLLPPKRGDRASARRLPGLRQLMCIVPIWMFYVVAVGADFMEFRFMVPITPLIALAVATLADAAATLRRQVWVALLLAFASLGHLALPSLGYPVTTLHDLAIWPAPSPYSLASMGKQLARTFPGGIDRPGQVTMAIGSLGALPYYSQLPTVDMLGLTDPFIAAHGERPRFYYPGHVRMAPVDYLVDRNVNLVASVRITARRDALRRNYRISELIALYPVVDLRELPERARVVEVPIDDANAWLAIYLTPHPEVDRAIAEDGWRAYPIDRRCVPADVPALVGLFGTRSCG